MEKDANQLERDHVHSVYEKIAPCFNDTRYKAWPKVQQFISEQEPGSLIADIGCGNGKYLHINSQVYKLGCDYCFPLVESARNEGHEVMVCHSLCLPYRSECFDAVLSIAVIHHFSTEERRMRAIKEMARILRVGGQIMIYVWAMEQKRRRFEKQDVFVPWNPSPPSCSSGEPCSRGVQKSILHKDKELALNQPCQKLDGTSEVHRTARSSSCRGEKKASHTVLEKSLRRSLFSRSLDSVLDVDDQWHQEELIRYRNYDVQLNELKREKKVGKNREHGFLKRASDFFLHCKPSFEKTTAFEVAVKPVLPMSHCSKAFRGCYSELGQATLQLPMAAESLHDCSGVCLPDLISHQKELAVRQQLKIDHHPKEGAFCQPQNKRRTGSSLVVNECALAMQSGQQAGPDGAWLRYYHVFKEGELAELIERHIPELHITHSYFDHANWCVIAEKTDAWKI
ncbi:PREDICTED: probable tRNA methyltransferase 9-like protein [Calidris pugnax]|uniref:probable tRNA methyltransferase 9-like protein n=1 Tax=Calidris pugnax TaxID=198806 RepID=UPI00071CA985|nr:PREDICTED: probable tRNA methyltransferase 9-like protein [Calidris pugnax]